MSVGSCGEEYVSSSSSSSHSPSSPPSGEVEDYLHATHHLYRQLMKTSNNLRERTAQLKGNWKNPILFKTTLCDYWVSSAECKFGSRCWYAHGPDELRYVPRLDELPNIEAIKHALFVDPASSAQIPGYLEFCHGLEENNKATAFLETMVGELARPRAETEASTLESQFHSIPEIRKLSWSDNEIRKKITDEDICGFSGMEIIPKHVRDSVLQFYKLGRFTPDEKDFPLPRPKREYTDDEALDLDLSFATSRPAQSPIPKPNHQTRGQGSEHLHYNESNVSSTQPKRWKHMQSGSALLEQTREAFRKYRSSTSSSVSSEDRVEISVDLTSPSFCAPPGLPPPPGFPPKVPLQNHGYAGYGVHRPSMLNYDRSNPWGQDPVLMRRIDEESESNMRRTSRFSRTASNFIKPVHRSDDEYSSIDADVQSLNRSFVQPQSSHHYHSMMMNRSFF